MPPSLQTLRRVCWAGVFLWAAGVFAVSELSSRDIERLNVFNLWDKGLHALAFLCGALPLVPALRLSRPWPWGKIARIAIVALSVYGALDEIHQRFTPSRSSLDPLDWLADTFGAAAGVAAAIFIHARIERRQTRPAPAGN